MTEVVDFMSHTSLAADPGKLRFSAGAPILAAVDLDHDIPVEAFVAVAEILRYVYAANGTQPPEFSHS